MIHSPGSLTVECDVCGEEKEFDVTEFAGDPEAYGVDDSTLEGEGWSVDGREHYCPECTKLNEEEEDA